ncbi:MAG: protein translocase subunit SecD [Pelagibacterales bacterium]|nr:protein translocase subunit SecD [Pelagibacterales bacterium]OUU61980.1 MAG: protein translocase subunit SecD [Alphaproteobacteria bacterium TMED62]|tara:strand:- start:486 stop:2027 length:1542 start_codon:yes stop_codon:yes gene_type:complete
MKKYSFKFISFITIALFSLFFAIPALINIDKNLPNWVNKNKLKLGLDLQGGSQLLLQVETDKAIQEKVQTQLEDIRVALLNVDIQPEYMKLINNTIAIKVVEEDINQLEKIVNENNQLRVESNNGVFKINFTEKFIREFQSSVIVQSLEIIRKRVDEVGTNEPIIQIQGKQRVLVQLPGLEDPDRIKSLLGKTAKMNFRMVDEKSMSQLGEKKYFVGSEILEGEEFGVDYIIKKRIGVSGDNLVDASASVDQFNRPIVSIRFDSIGSRKFADLTAKNVGKRFAIVLDKKVISAPVIREAIPSGSAQISGNFSFDSANDLAILLRAGSLPAPISIIEERSVGPSLGQDSINAGVVSVIIALSLVLVYMVFIYGKIGLIANFVLVINFLFIIAWLVLLQATLTLPGIAGIALTVGMAVDANVLVFERIREEKMLGRSKISAINTGFDQALRAILDANVTTLIAALILFFLGSGPIRGFSITLGLGVVSTILCTMIISRLLINHFYIQNSKRDIEI